MIARKVAPDRAALVAEKLATIRLTAKRMEDELRAAAVTGRLALQAPEIGRERNGCGLDHPKLCEKARAFLSRCGGGR